MTGPGLSFGTWPTPVEAAPRLAVRLGLGPDDLLLKRDDLVGLGGGGNKARKLGHLAAAALADGADTFVTSGAVQSNHARLTAAAAARLGVGAVLVLAGTRTRGATGNLSLDGLFGARVVWAGEVDDDGLDAAVVLAAERLRAAGARPAVFPLGGSDAVGARGYLDCAAELTDQVPDLAHVVTAVGTGGTMAGLAAGLGVERVLAVDVGATADPAVRVTRLLAALGVHGAAIRLRLDQVGTGYGTPTASSGAALLDAARTEGVVLDPVYTAKALAGLAAAVAEGDIRPGQRTVFLNTGGLPGLFGHPAATELAAGLAAGLPAEPGSGLGSGLGSPRR